jgi:ADP-heptose:LPS heptosyltransferase
MNTPVPQNLLRHPAERAMTPSDWAPLENVLAVRLDSVGDVLLAGPAMRAIKQVSPRARLTLLASPSGAHAVPLLPEVDRVIVHKARWQELGDVSLSAADALEDELVGELAAHEFDSAVIFTSFSQSPYPPAMLCCRAGIDVRVGQSKEFGGAVLTHWTMPGRDEAHQVERNLALLGHDQSFPDYVSISIPPAAEDAAGRLLASVGLADRTFIVLAPGASCSARRYPRFRAVAKQLDRAGASTLVVGSAGEVELASWIADGIESCVSVAGLTSVPELAALVGRSAAVIANNSLALHLAEALLRPLVVVYSGADALTQYGPRHTRFAVLGETPECSPCHAFDCPAEDMRCLDIDPREVAAKASEFAYPRQAVLL